MNGHPYRGGVRFRFLRSLPICEICGLAAHDPVHLMIFAGMESAVELQHEAAAVHQGEELTAKLLEPLGDIDRKAGEMERNSPLFYGQVTPTLF
jgi:hypothetical protein